jgi:hypothetical protein
MVDLKKESLEKAINKSPQETGMSKEEEIGFHKGAITTLINERNELIKMIGNVDAIMQAHIKRLEELGVKVQRKEQ